MSESERLRKNDQDRLFGSIKNVPRDTHNEDVYLASKRGFCNR